MIINFVCSAGLSFESVSVFWDRSGLLDQWPSWLARGFQLLHFIFLIGGGVLLQRWVITPLITRRRIMSGEMAGAELTRKLELTFDEAQIKLTADNQMEKVYGWDLVKTVYEQKNGFLFTFTDGLVHWLPDRAFRDARTRNAFRALLRQKTKLVTK